MVVSIIGLTLVALYTLLPVNYINRIIFPMKEEDITDDLYENIEGTFLEVSNQVIQNSSFRSLKVDGTRIFLLISLF